MNSNNSKSGISRREFLSGLGTAGIAGAGISLGFSEKLFAHTPKPELDSVYGRNAGQWIPSCCHMCGGTSGILTHVIDGKVRKIEPNPYNPINIAAHPDDFFQNVGKPGVASLCAKGNSGIMALYDADRIKKPLKRTNPNKGFDQDPGWKEISWESALEEVTAALRGLKNQGEAHKLLWMTEDNSFVDIQKDFTSLYGTPNFFMHSNLCDTGRKASAKWVLGHDRPLCDFYNIKYIMLWGWNPLEAMKWIYLPRAINNAVVEKGAKLVVIDPVASVTAMKAHRWLKIKAGTDGALALAMANVIIRENLHDKEFIDRWSVGFEKFSEYVKDKTPEWAEKITTIPARTINEVAVDFASAKPAVAADAWSGFHYTNGVQAGRAVFLLNALAGSIEQPGGLVIPNKKGSKHTAAKGEEIEKPMFIDKSKYLFYHGSGVYGKIFTDIAAARGPYDIKAIVCVFQNPAMSVPSGLNLFPEVAKKVEKIFVVDNMISETALFADILLPGTTYLERYEVVGQWVFWPMVSLRQPVVKPIFGQPAEYELVIELARRLGLKQADGEDFFRIGRVSGNMIEDKTKWYEEMLSKDLLDGEPKISLDELKKLPGAVWVAPKEKWSYRKHENEVDLTKPSKPGNKIKIEGSIVYEIDPNEKDEKNASHPIGIVIDGKPLKGFGTKSRKIEFYSDWVEGKKDALGNDINPLPVYQEINPAPTSEFPLICINWKEATHTQTRTQNNRWLLEVKPSNPIYVHPVTAQKYGLNDQDVVRVKSQYGQAVGKVTVTTRIHPQVIGAMHGFGRLALGSAAKKAGGFAGASALNTPGHNCPISGQALNKHVIVKVEKV